MFYGNDVLHEIQLLFNDLGVPFAIPAQTVNLTGGVPAVLPAGPEPNPGK